MRKFVSSRIFIFYCYNMVFNLLNYYDFENN